MSIPGQRGYCSSPAAHCPQFIARFPSFQQIILQFMARRLPLYADYITIQQKKDAHLNGHLFFYVGVKISR